MKLVESILSEDFVSASSILESRLNHIVEMKLIEMKKSMQAEATGGETAAQRAAKVKAGYVRASAPPEEGGLGLSPYDKGREKVKNRAAAGARNPKTSKRKAEPTPSVEPKSGGINPDLKTLKAAPRTMRVPNKEIIAGGEREQRARFLASRGSHAAKRWLKATSVQRNVAGYTSTMKNFGKDLIKGLSSMGEDTE